ncbi:MAG: hypothetical protein HJJLKODD_00253 [Phycisphaerae bacterium]|nr:hypothetical protein [Phycisphaerae bacterium]
MNAFLWRNLILLAGAWWSPPEAQPTPPAVAAPTDEVTAPAPEQQGWLGVQLVEPDPVLAAQLGLENKGLVILNVSTGSPAEIAGLQQYDILLEFNGATVPSASGQLADRIRSMGAGQTVAIRYLRLAAPVDGQVVLQPRPTQSKIVWKYESQPQEIFSQDYAAKARVFRRTPQGELILENVQEIPELQNQLHMLIDLPQKVQTQVWWEDGRLVKQHQVVEGDNTYYFRTIDKQPTIDVQRLTVQNGQENVQNHCYSSLEALRDADPTVYQIYCNHVQPTATMTWVANTAPAQATTVDLAREHEWLAQLEAERAAQEAQLQRWQIMLKESLTESGELRQQALRKYQIALEQARQAEAQLQQLGSVEFAPENAMAPEALLTFRFMTAADGTLQVTVRQEDTELVMSFNSAEELREKKPRLFERYQKLQASE